MSCVGCAYYSDLKEPRVQKHKEGFGGEYQHALVKEDVAIEWWRDNT